MCNRLGKKALIARGFIKPGQPRYDLRNRPDRLLRNPAVMWRTGYMATLMHEQEGLRERIWDANQPFVDHKNKDTAKRRLFAKLEKYDNRCRRGLSVRLCKEGELDPRYIAAARLWERQNVNSIQTTLPDFESIPMHPTWVPGKESNITMVGIDEDQLKSKE